MFTNTTHKTSPPKFLLAALLAINLTTAVYGQYKNDTHEGHKYDAHEDYDRAEHEEDLVSVSPEVLREFEITLATAASGTLHEAVILPGEIQFNRERLAYITPRHDGTVTAIHTRLTG